jgi:DnaK suppressor protein
MAAGDGVARMTTRTSDAAGTETGEEGVAMSEAIISGREATRDAADIIDHGSLLAELERLELPPGYRPSDDEPFMNERQLAWFRAKLLRWKADIAVEAKATLDTLKEGPIQEPDQTDRASSETDWALELRTRDRQRKLISKIDAALRRIDTGDYGYCEITGEPISLQRLEARPIATMTLEAQERHEREERVSRDD